MTTTPLPPKILDFLAGRNPAVIATVRPDGQPVSVATWYLLEGDEILVNMDESRRRLSYLREDPRVSLTVIAPDDWYTHVSLQGRVVRFDNDPDLADIDRLANHYRGHPYLNREQKRISAWIAVEAWHAWGALA